MHKWDIRNYIAFTGMLIAGIGLCVGSIWVAPLAVPGVAFITGALAMFGSAFNRQYQWETNEPTSASTQATPRHSTASADIEEASTTTQNTYVQNNMLFMYIRGLSGRPALNTPPPEPELETNNRLTIV